MGKICLEKLILSFSFTKRWIYMFVLNSSPSGCVKYNYPFQRFHSCQSNLIKYGKKNILMKGCCIVEYLTFFLSLVSKKMTRQ